MQVQKSCAQNFCTKKPHVKYLQFSCNSWQSTSEFKGSLEKYHYYDSPSKCKLAKPYLI